MKSPRVRFTVRRIMLAVAAVAIALSGGRWFRLRQVAQEVQARRDRALDYARLARQADELAETFAKEKDAARRDWAKELRSAAIEFRNRSRRFCWAASRPELPLSRFRSPDRNR